MIYIITFGGFIGLATFLPSFYYGQFHVSKIQAGNLTVLATLTGSIFRVVGGWFADKIGGIITLSVVFLIVIAGLFGLMTTPPLMVTTPHCSCLCFAALGARGMARPSNSFLCAGLLTTAVAGGMIGEIGAIGGSILPNLLGQSKQHTGTYAYGFALYALWHRHSCHTPAGRPNLDCELGGQRREGVGRAQRRDGWCRLIGLKVG